MDYNDKLGGPNSSDDPAYKSSPSKKQSPVRDNPNHVFHPSINSKSRDLGSNVGDRNLHLYKMDEVQRNYK